MYEEVKTGEQLRDILQDRIISHCGMLKGSKETCVIIKTHDKKEIVIYADKVVFK